MSRFIYTKRSLPKWIPICKKELDKLPTWIWRRILTLSKGATTVLETAAEIPPAIKSRRKSLFILGQTEVSEKT